MIKRLVERLRNGTEEIHWVIYEHGHFTTPLVILDEDIVRLLVFEYCAAKGLTLVQEEEGENAED